jgi:MoaA/NifB/PqqE/SkfB family radical SAM enzyme
MCNRNLYGGLKNPKLEIAEWSLEDFQNIFDKELVEQLVQVLFCGHFGDPLINPDFLYMIKYLKDINPNIMINVHTNGSFYKEEWWVEFAKFLPKLHSVHIGIDGLEDTHKLYRIGTDWNKIIKNAKAFISFPPLIIKKLNLLRSICSVFAIKILPK